MRLLTFLLVVLTGIGCEPRPQGSSKAAPVPPQPAPHPDANGLYRVGGPITEPYDLFKTPVLLPEACRLSLKPGPLAFEAVLTVDGDLRNVTFKSADRFDPPCPMFEKQAIAAIATWKYEPATLRGRPVPVLLTIVPTPAP